jgi:ankyrin repeat protein
MKVFGSELALATKLAFNLSQYGANLNFKNIIQHTPIHQALYYSQIEAIKFALEHNERIKNMN